MEITRTTAFLLIAGLRLRAFRSIRYGAVPSHREGFRGIHGARFVNFSFPIGPLWRTELSIPPSNFPSLRLFVEKDHAIYHKSTDHNLLE